MSSVEFCDSTDANVQRAQDGYNQFNILCPRCSSIVLRKNTAKLANKPHNLPVFARKSELCNPSKEFPTELTEEFWCVNDMYAFENVGFTNTVMSKRQCYSRNNQRYHKRLCLTIQFKIRTGEISFAIICEIGVKNNAHCMGSHARNSKHGIQQIVRFLSREPVCFYHNIKLKW